MENFQERINHTDVLNLFIMHDTKDKTLYMKKISTKDNPASMLIKKVPKAKFEHCLDLVSIHTCPS